MNRIARLFEALQNSRKLEADRVIRRYWHLVEEAHEYERKREIEATYNNVGRTLERTFITGESLCNPQI
jgi:hypothetical protein